MTSLIQSRRGFLTGLSAALAAPAIVRAGSLMPVRLFNPYYERYLMTYDIGTDLMMLRIDRAQFPLPVPAVKNGLVYSVSKQFAETIINRSTINTMQPEPRQQLCMSMVLPGLIPINKEQ